VGEAKVKGGGRRGERTTRDILDPLSLLVPPRARVMIFYLLSERMGKA